MNIRVMVEPDAGSWRGQVSLESCGMTQVELQALAAFGVFSVDVGGSFTGTGPLSAVSFSLSSQSVGLPDGFPLIEVFTGTDTNSNTAGQRAAVWAQTMQTRVSSALSTWLANSVTLESDKVYTIP